MTKLIGIKELQQNTKRVREEVSQGVSFVVIYRTKPIFEIKPVSSEFKFADDLKLTGLYTNKFIERMEEAEQNIQKGKTKTYTTDEFLKSLK